MKFESYKDKSMSKRIVLLSIIVLISVSLLFYKNNNLKENKDNVYFAFYNDNEKLDSMPLKDNSDGLLFSHGECDNGAYIEWNKEKWAPLVKNLSKSKTKCSLYFGKPKELGKDILPVESGDGLYAVNHDVSEISTDWNKTEYRYAGANPNNYVSFNNEIWRMIGLVNVKTDSEIEQRLKIVRVDGVNNQKDFGNYAWDKASDYSNNWASSGLKNMLNGIYYERASGECYTGVLSGATSQSTCDFSSGIDLPKGLDGTARNMIDKDVIWNIAGSSAYQNITINTFYEIERGTSTYGSNPSEWSNTTDVDGKHNGIGLLYPSDYAYATNGGSLGRNECFEGYLSNWNTIVDGKNYSSECAKTDWLKTNIEYMWTITPITFSYDLAFGVYTYGSVYSGSNVYRAGDIWPVAYLTSSTKIVDGKGTIDNPFILG